MGPYADPVANRLNAALVYTQRNELVTPGNVVKGKKKPKKQTVKPAPGGTLAHAAAQGFMEREAEHPVPKNVKVPFYSLPRLLKISKNHPCCQCRAWARGEYLRRHI